jgi:thiamine-phosphate pyrophosphorylase
MRWVILSPEDERPDEAAIATCLIEAGASRYHVRKPGWSRERLGNWLATVPLPLLTRCVLHSHHDLALGLPLLGRHWRDEAGLPDEMGPGFTSRSCHSIESLTASFARFSSVFYSPVFSSVSKPGYGGNAGLGAIPSLLNARNETHHRTEVIALGGITPAGVAACAAWGFDGVATLGWVWQATDPVGAFNELKSAVSLGHASRS